MATYARALAQNPTAGTLLGQIVHGDTAARAAAVREAPLVGTAAIVPLGEVYGGSDPAAAKAALEALRRVAHHAARPGAATERRAAATALLTLTDAARPRRVRAEALHLLGAVGEPESVGRLERLLADADVREDARMALERIPGREADSALRRAAGTVATDYRPAVEQSLRHRRTRMKGNL